MVDFGLLGEKVIATIGDFMPKWPIVV